MKPIALAALLLSFSPSLATAGWGSHDLEVSTRGGAPLICSDLEVTVGHRPAAVAEQAMTLAAGQTVRVRAARNSGISVEAADRRDVAILACKAASTEMPELRAALTRTVWPAARVIACSATAAGR